MIRKIKWFWQRHTKGFDNTDIWDLDYTFAVFILPRLREFRKHYSGTPGSFESCEEWEATLDKMIYAFEYLILDANCEIEWDSPDEYRAIQHKISEGLELFGKYFRALWS